MTMRAMANTDQLTPDPGRGELLPRCAESLERLFTIYYDRIFAFCVHRLFCRDAAEEVTSQVFLTVARKFNTFRGETDEAFAGWVYAIAVNHCRSWRRKTKRQKILFEQFQAERPHCVSGEVRGTSDWSRLYTAIASLQETEQTVITLRYFESMSYEQIAVITGKRINAVRVNLHRGLRKLQTRLGSDFFGVDR